MEFLTNMGNSFFRIFALGFLLATLSCLGCGSTRMANECGRCSKQLEAVYNALCDYAKNHKQFPLDSSGQLNWKVILGDNQASLACPQSQLDYIVFHPNLHAEILNPTDDALVVIASDRPGNHPVPWDRAYEEPIEYIQVLYSNGKIRSTVASETDIKNWLDKCKEKEVPWDHEIMKADD